VSYLEDALFPSEAHVRDIAKQLYNLTRGLPIISPHGHVDLSLLIDNKPFANASELFIFFDHYVTRALHSAGVPLVNVRQGADPRSAWSIFASHWNIFAGTASGYWLKNEFATLFNIHDDLTIENADNIYDAINASLNRPEFLPRALFSRFTIAFLATTDDPTDDVSAHRKISQELSSRIVPTYRPDKYIQVHTPAFVTNVQKLISTAGLIELTFANFMKAFEITRAQFIAAGAISIDIGVEDPYTCELSDAEAGRIFDAVVSGTSTKAEMRDLAGNLLYRLIGMSCDDGLVVTLHAGVIRNHHQQTFEKLGPDHGSDLPLQVEFVRNLKPVLNAYGTNPNLQLILFCVDEAALSRDVAPLAGFYPAVYVGAPWWFIDAPYSLQRFRESTVETIGFYKGSGFIDDTRAFLSIPARHDMARRVDAGVLARLVDQNRISFEQARTIAVDLVTKIPSKAFKL